MNERIAQGLEFLFGPITDESDHRSQRWTVKAVGAVVVGGIVGVGIGAAIKMTDAPLEPAVAWGMLTGIFTTGAILTD